MKPDIQEPGGTNPGSHRPRVRLFIALHLGAVGTIYAVALLVGGGFAGPPMPPLTLAMTQQTPTPVAPVPAAASNGAQVLDPSSQPAWTQRAEIAAPWESR